MPVWLYTVGFRFAKREKMVKLKYHIKSCPCLQGRRRKDFPAISDFAQHSITSHLPCHNYLTWEGKSKIQRMTCPWEVTSCESFLKSPTASSCHSRQRPYTTNIRLKE